VQKVSTMKTVDRFLGNDVDMAELLTRVENDRELLHEIFDIYKAEFPPLFLLLKEALDRGDMKELRIRAHTMKGMLESLTFRKASASAMWIERMPEGALPADILAELERLRIHATAAEAGLDEACNQVIQ
jgi:HPt (histidine-containing phosphotransfer) domain-containing protein